MVLPAYNEEAAIGRVLDRIDAALKAAAVAHEVIVVDDGSRDATSTVGEDCVERHYPAVRLLVHDSNRGYGAAIRTGLQHAGLDLVFYTDADRQYDIAELAYFLPYLEDNDLVIGFRVYRYDSVLRSVVSWVYNRIVGVLFRVRVRDVDCSFKLMRREVTDKLALEADDFFIDTEIIARARKWNFRIAQKGVRHYPRVAGATTVRASDVWRTLKTIAHMWHRIYLPTRAQHREGEAIAGRVIATEYRPAAAKR